MKFTWLNKSWFRTKNIGLGLLLALSASTLSQFVHAEPDIDCTIPLAVVCEVNDTDGFHSVRVNVDFGPKIGTIDVVTQNFTECQYSTTVGWDPIVPNFQIFTTPCEDKGSKFKYLGRGKSSKSHEISAKAFTIVTDKDGYPLRVNSIKPDIIPLSENFSNGIEDPGQYELLETECTWTNNNQAACLVWDCDDEGICVEYGQYCLDKYGNDVACAE
ncbi:hypothetical protein [Microbulbifer discodermiae]|uniref:hypothetical protein n=1 Tax=Microbulbifer sp. 2201CG32-9 TaxID=3232309 RepID=UPI00345C0EC1